MSFAITGGRKLRGARDTCPQGLRYMPLPPNLVNFGPETAKNGWRVFDHPLNFRIVRHCDRVAAPRPRLELRTCAISDSERSVVINDTSAKYLYSSSSSSSSYKHL